MCIVGWRWACTADTCGGFLVWSACRLIPVFIHKNNTHTSCLTDKLSMLIFTLIFMKYVFLPNVTIIMLIYFSCVSSREFLIYTHGICGITTFHEEQKQQEYYQNRECWEKIPAFLAYSSGKLNSLAPFQELVTSGTCQQLVHWT